MRLHYALLASTALAADGRAQLLPVGEFAARDGRPGPGKTWKLTDAQGQALAARVNDVASRTPIVVDYDHQTLPALLGKSTGALAPAAGWITGAQWVRGQGLFATINWTDRAKALIQAREYLYFSPVIEADEETGEVTGVLLGALVNYPALLGMEAVSAALHAQFAAGPQTTGTNPAAAHQVGAQQTHQAASSAAKQTPTEPAHMSKIALSKTLITALTTLLWMPVDATEDDLVHGIKVLREKAQSAADTPAIPAALAGELGVAATADAAAAVAAVAALKARADAAAGNGTAASATALAGAMTQIAALQAQLQQLTKVQTEAQLADAVDGAIAADKAVPAMREQLIHMGRQAGLQALQAMLQAMPAIPGLSGQRTDAAAAAAATAGAASRAPQIAALQGADALAIARNCGISPEAWAKHVTALAGKAAAH